MAPSGIVIVKRTPTVRSKGAERAGGGGGFLKLKDHGGN
jgi:hypothetical protein